MRKNLIKVKNKSKTEEVIVRKSWIYLLGIVFVYCTIVVITIGLIIMLWPTLVESNQTIKTVFATIIISLASTINIIFINILVRYFYDILIINEKRIVNIIFGVFFTSDIQIIEIYRVQSVESNQTGIFKALFNFGTITLKIQTGMDATDDLTYKFITKPTKLAMTIEKMKQKSMQRRLQTKNKQNKDQL